MSCSERCWLTLHEGNLVLRTTNLDVKEHNLINAYLQNENEKLHNLLILQAPVTKHVFSFFLFGFMCHCWSKALVLPKAEQVLQTSIQPYIGSILEALMEPTSRGFSEVRDVFFKELVELSKNSLNGGGKEKIGDVSHVLLSANFDTLL